VLGSLLLPLTSSFGEKWLASTVAIGMPTACDGLHGCSHRGRDSDGVRVIASTTFDSIAGWQKSVEALNEVRMTGK
jgi:hypothetical protein